MHRRRLNERCRWIAADWADALALKADLILSNPPYIPADDIAGLAREVRSHDPARALDGGADGLEPIAALPKRCPAARAEGLAVIELGIGHARRSAQ